MRIVLDTNVWLDLFVFDDPRVRLLGTRLSERAVTPWASPAMLQELAAVLDYAHLRARCADPSGLLARVHALCALIDAPEMSNLPRCRDPDDQKFLDAAAAAEVRLLVSKDKALLSLARRVRGFSILAPGPALDARLALGASP